MMTHRRRDLGERQEAGERPDSLRADAQHNRDRILQVAHDALAASGDASLTAAFMRTASI